MKLQQRFPLVLVRVLLVAAVCAVAPFASAQETAGKPYTAEQVRGTRHEGTRTAAVGFLELERQEAANPDMGPIKRRAVKSPAREVEENLPVPEIVEPQHASGAPDTLEPLGPSPVLASSFLASEDAVNDGFRNIPPDTHGAVGPNHLVTTLNGRVRVQSKTGALLSTVGLRTFWSRLFPGRPVSELDVFDPKVLYDPYGGRWMITSCADRNTPDSAVLIGVSQTSDPTGTWFLYSADADTANLQWADFPSIGFNKNWIVVQMNMFGLSGASTSNNGKFFVFDKAQLYAGPASITFSTIPIATGGFTMSPAATYDPNLETLYTVQTWNGGNSSGGVLRVGSITNVAGLPVFTALSFPIASGFSWNNDAEPTGALAADSAPQKDSARKIQTNDNRMHGVVYRNGSLWCAHTVFTPSAGPTRSTIQWWELNPTATTGVAVQPRQRGLIDASGTDWYAFPSIAVNKNNDVLIGYTRFSPAQYPSAHYSFRAAADPAGMLRDDAVLKAGESFYYKTFSTEADARNRWGDYSATIVDPSNDLDLWTIQEYAAARGTGSTNDDNNSRWGTWWGRIALGTTTPAPLPLLQFGLSAYTLSEDQRSMQVEVARSGDTTGASSVDYATSDASALERNDYTLTTGTLQFAAGETTKTVTVFITDDAFVEGTESFNLTLANPVGATLGTRASTEVRVFDNDSAGAANPINGSQFFVRQHYVDFLNREPDASGLNFWTNDIESCGANTACREVKRVNVSAAFFLSIEFKETGYLVYRFHQTAFDTGERLQLRTFLSDTQEIGRGVVVGAAGWDQQLEANKQAFAARFVARPQFTTRYPQTLTPAQFVDALNTNTGNSLTLAERNALVGELTASNTSQGRASVLRKVAENAEFQRRQLNRAFVLMQYFGYLRRNPNDAPDSDFGGFNFWLGKLNQFGGNYEQAEMVKAFINSTEYKGRFGL